MYNALNNDLDPRLVMISTRHAVASKRRKLQHEIARCRKRPETCMCYSLLKDVFSPLFLLYVSLHDSHVVTHLPRRSTHDNAEYFNA